MARSGRARVWGIYRYLRDPLVADHLPMGRRLPEQWLTVTRRRILFRGLLPAAVKEREIEFDGFSLYKAQFSMFDKKRAYEAQMKSGVPWTEEEHRLFLLGLQKLGKGDWRGISRNYVITRTPTQVASHAQKYFIRQTNACRRKRRTSLFDIVPDETVESQFLPANFEEPDTQQACSSTPAHLPLDEECESMDSNNYVEEETTSMIPEVSELQCSHPAMYPAYFSPFFPFTLPWPGCTVETVVEPVHEIVKPTPVHTKSPINVDELLGISKLSIVESGVEEITPSISVNLLGGSSSRHSAFHANTTTAYQKTA